MRDQALFDKLDLHLIRVLHTVLTERSVSKAAIRLGMYQPAVSASLKKLRELAGDPLLVRSGAGMVPTDAGLRMLAPSASILRAAESMFSDARSFEPGSTRQTFRIAASDFLDPLFLPRLVAQIKQQAPHGVIEILPLSAESDYRARLAQGDMDGVIGNWLRPPEELHLGRLMSDEIVCLVAASHPCAKKGMSVDDYMRAAHVVPMPYSISQRGVIDGVLASMRINRDERVAVQSFTAAPYLLQGTDLVFTTTRHFAQFYANLLPLAIIPSPIAFPPMRFYQLWHERNHHSTGHRWLRRLLSDCGRRIAPPHA